MIPQSRKIILCFLLSIIFTLSSCNLLYCLFQDDTSDPYSGDWKLTCTELWKTELIDPILGDYNWYDAETGHFYLAAPGRSNDGTNYPIVYELDKAGTVCATILPVDSATALGLSCESKWPIWVLTDGNRLYIGCWDRNIVFSRHEFFCFDKTTRQLLYKQTLTPKNMNDDIAGYRPPEIWGDYLVFLQSYKPASEDIAYTEPSIKLRFIRRDSMDGATTCVRCLETDQGEDVRTTSELPGIIKDDLIYLSTTNASIAIYDLRKCLDLTYSETECRVYRDLDGLSTRPYSNTNPCNVVFTNQWYAYTSYGDVIAREYGTNTLCWKYDNPYSWNSNGMNFLHGDALISSDICGFVRSLDVVDGTINWETIANLSGNADYGFVLLCTKPLVIADSYLLTLDGPKGAMVFLDIKTGKILLKYPLPKYGAYPQVCNWYVDDTLFCIGDTYFAAYRIAKK
jgi:hypothetical protein